MGFDWNAEVAVGYVQEVEFLNCYSRFATRCLKLANPVPSGFYSIGISFKKTEKRRLPGEPLTDEELMGDDDYPFSETEDDLAALRPEHRKLYDKLKTEKHGNHAEYDEIIHDLSGESILDKAFHAAVEQLLPGKGDYFKMVVKDSGGAYGEAGEGASEEISYLVYKPTLIEMYGDDIDVGRGTVTMPWGYMLTPLLSLDAETAKQVDAAFAVIIDKLGLKGKGKAGLSLITLSSGG